MKKLSWIDLRNIGELADEITEEALHVGVSAFVVKDAEQAGRLPPSACKVAVVDRQPADAALLEQVQIVLVKDGLPVDFAVPDGVELGVFIEVTGEATLTRACELSVSTPWLLVEFLQDPSKIPLEILLAAADRAAGELITVVANLEDAEVTLNVLQRGPEGVLLTPTQVGQATQLVSICSDTVEDLQLEEIEIVGLTHLGPGERVCVDTCSRFEQDEGILVGSYSTGMILISSETHPLPYMPTRPFRVNAAALHSYVVAPDNRTRYLAELESGAEILAVNVQGKARRVVVGRAKVETRPLLLIEAKNAANRAINIIAQDDWHVRVLGPKGSVHNITELKRGDRILGYTLDAQRHVGYPIREFLHEQ
ncbi:3-dehydroquinate synthase [Burkholderia cepacia]|uniref:3-dehydroquinate synthase II family protein n=1 Tax=Burkholderia cepacia TaxID=292 RepID=UPI00075FC16E|nr:3-dehydroquinate synthase II family protein [Burkholderia cepacia]KWO07062.1 3-dehydroquinate synthase [Burkholderia cepacia]